MTKKKSQATKAKGEERNDFKLQTFFSQGNSQWGEEATYAMGEM